MRVTRYIRLLYFVLFVSLWISFDRIYAQVWDGSASTTWNDANNWNTPVAVPGATSNAIFNVATGNDPNFTAAASVGRLTFTGTSDAEIFTGAALTINGISGIGIDNQIAQIHTFNNPIVVGGSQTWQSTAAGGGLTFNSTINLSSFNLTFDPQTLTSTIALSTGAGDVISGTGSMTKNGLGAVTLGNVANTFSGGFTLNLGTVSIANNASLGTGTVTLSGGTLTPTADLTLANNLTINDNTTISAANNVDLIFSSSTISASAGNTLTINNSSGAGTMSVGFSGSGFNFASGINLNNAFSQFRGLNTAGTQTFSGPISGAGTVLRNAAGGTTVLSGNNTFSGGTTITLGTLESQSTAGLGTGNVSLNGGTLAVTTANQSYNQTFTANAASTINVATGITLSIGNAANDLRGANALTKTGGGTLLLPFSNNYSGQWTVTAGTLQSAANGSLGRGNMILNGGTLSASAVNQSYDRTITVNAASGIDVASGISLNLGNAANDLTGAGNLSKSGTGTLIIDQANNWTGAMTISNGIVQIANATALGTAAGGVSVISGATLQMSNGITSVAGETLTLNGTGAGGIGALNNGSGNNTWNGNMILASDSSIINDVAGTTLTFQSYGPTRRDLTNNGFVLTIDGAGDVRFNGQTTGTGGLIKNGTGTFLLTDGGLASFSSYSGNTLINSGTMILDMGNTTYSPLGGTMTVGDGVGSDLLMLRWRNQLSGTADLMIKSSGRVELDDFYGGTKSQTIGLLRMEGGGFITNDANFNLVLNSNVVREITGNTSAVIAGRLDLGGTTRTFYISNNATASQDMVVSAVLSNGSLTKEGAGTLTLSNANTYTGDTTVNAGVLETANNSALGSSGRLIVSNGAIVSNTSTSVNGAGIYSAANRSVIVTGSGSTWTNPGILSVGDSTAGNSLTISNGGTVYSTNLIVGSTVASTGNSVGISGGSSSLIVTNSTGSGLIDIRRGTNTQDGGLVLVDNLSVTNASGAYRLNGGTLSVNGNATNNNGQLFFVGNGSSSALYNSDGGSHVFANGLVISNNGTMNMTNNSIIANTVIAAGGNLTLEGSVTNQGSFLNQSSLMSVNVSEASGDMFYVTGSMTNSGTINLNNETGGSSNPTFQGIDFGGTSFTNSGTIVWNFSAPPSGGLGTPLNPYLGGMRSTNNIFAAYQNPSGFFTSGFTVTGLNSNQYLKSAFSGGFYYLAVIPEPSTYVLFAIGLAGILYHIRLSRKSAPFKNRQARSQS